MLSVQPKGKQKGCAGCNRKIKDRYLLKALDKYWHEDCLKCACCDCRLGEVGSTLYTKANLILCRRDYLRQEKTHTLPHSRHTLKSRHFHSCEMSKGQRFLSTAFSEMKKKKKKNLRSSWGLVSLRLSTWLSCQHTRSNATFFCCSSSSFPLAFSVILLPSAPLYFFFF